MGPKMPATLVAVAIAAASCGKSDDAAQVPATAATVATAAAPASRPSGFQPGDSVEVRIPGLTGAGTMSTNPVRVQSDGAVALPYLVAPVVIVGTDPAEAGRRVAAAYRAANILSTATVSVRRIDYPSTATDAAPRVGLPTTHPNCYDAGDLLEVRIAGLTGEADATSAVPVRVQADGTIRLPLVADVHVGGRDAAAAAKAIADAFRSANILSQAAVSIRRLQVAGTGGPTPGPIAPYDLVRCVTVSATPGRGGPVVIARVDGHGDLAVPFVPPVHVAGLTDGDASVALLDAYHTANVVGGSGGLISVLTLERAPADAGRVALPDVPIQPVPEPLRFLYEPN